MPKISKNQRKFDRNSKWCEAYRNRNQRERNKAKRLLKHFARYGFASASAVHCYNNLPMLVKPAAVRVVAHEKPKGKRLAPRVPMTVVPTPRLGRCAYAKA